MRYSPPAERHERHESTPDPAKHETNLGVGWTPPVFPSGDTNTMMKLKDWLSFTLNYVIWIGYHKFLLKMHQTGARQGTPQEKQNEAAPAKKTETDPAPLGQPSCSVATSSLRTWPSQETQPHPSPQRQMLRCSPSSWEEGHEEPGCVVVILAGMLLSLW